MSQDETAVFRHAGAPPSAPRSRIIASLPYLVAVVSLLATFFFWKQYDSSLEAQLESVFAEESEEVCSHFFKGLEDDEQVLRGAAGLLNASEEVTRDEWRRYVASLNMEKHYPGILGIGYSRMVAPGEKERFVSRVRREGFSDFSIKPEGERPEYSSIIFLEPFNWRNRRAFGYDMLSEPTRRSAMEIARDSGNVTIATPVILLQETKKDTQTGMLMYMPVYRREAAVGTAEERRKALEGYSYSPIRVDDFMSVAVPVSYSDIGYKIYANDRQDPDSLVYDSVKALNISIPDGYQAKIRAVRRIERFGRTWLFSMQALPDFAQRKVLNKSFGIIFAGLTVSALLTVIAFLLRRAHDRTAARAALLRESEEHYRRIADDSPAYISSFLPDGTITFVNRTFAKASGKQPGINLYDSLLPEFRELVRQQLNGLTLENPVETHEQALLGPDGTVIWQQWTNRAIFDQLGQAVSFHGVGHDITDRKRLEEESTLMQRRLQHSQRLESLGVLAGGVAHDFNNILTAILGNAELAMMRLPSDSPVIDKLNNISLAATRAADLARQMLAYSGRGRLLTEHLDLNHLLQDMRHILEASISKSAVIRFNPAAAIPMVEADANQLRQVIMNLIMNASEAIGEHDGVIIVTTGSIELDRPSLANSWGDEEASEGRYVYLEVVDSGCGMDSETLPKIFDPFFTTKFAGRGLGLAAVLGIVRSHKGVIKVSSEPGRGSAVSVLLPASTTVVVDNGSKTAAKDERLAGEGRVLLVDDEEPVRNIGCAMLMELGYVPVPAADGREALAIFEQTPDVAFVILDLTMPHMDGEECFYGLKKLNPDVRVIISSGYSEEEVLRKFLGKGIAGFVQKPYRLTNFKEAIARVLGPSNPPAV